MSAQIRLVAMVSLLWSIQVFQLFAIPPITESSFGGVRPGEVREIQSLKFCWCPAGRFVMGSPDTELDREQDEWQVQVEICNGFWMGQFEITQRDWNRRMVTQPWGEKAMKSLIDIDPDLPALNIRYNDACKFCKKLTDSARAKQLLPSGWSFNLPTEAQWEYGCRANSKTAFCYGDDPKELSPYCHFGDKKFSPIKVGSKLPNAWNLYDMHGNVVEWCQDTYCERLPGGKDPAILAVGDDPEWVLKVIRGGDFASPAGNCRSACRRSAPANFAGQAWADFTGLRVIISKDAIIQLKPEKSQDLKDSNASRAAEK